MELTLTVGILLDDLRTVDLSETVVGRASRRTGVGHCGAASGATAARAEYNLAFSGDASDGKCGGKNDRCGELEGEHCVDRKRYSFSGKRDIQ